MVQVPEMKGLVVLRELAAAECNGGEVKLVQLQGRTPPVYRLTVIRDEVRFEFQIEHKELEDVSSPVFQEISRRIVEGCRKHFSVRSGRERDH